MLSDNISNIFSLFTAIKTGRYTHEKKTKDIEEVKRLQVQLRLKANKSEPMSISGEESQSLGSSPTSLSSRSSASPMSLASPGSPASEEELEQIIQHITSIHQQQTPHTPEFFAKLPEKEKEFLVSV